MISHIGIELTPSYFKLVEVSKGFGRIKLKKVIVHSILGVWSEQGSFLEKEELVHSIQEALQGQGMHTRQVRVAISSKEVILKRVIVPEMRKVMD